MSRSSLTALCLLAAAPAMAASDAFYEFGDWSASRIVLDPAFDRVTVPTEACRAATGGDGDPVVEVLFILGDTAPPAGWPTVTVSESAPRGHATALRGGEGITFLFDGGISVFGESEDGHDQEGFAVASARAYSGEGGDQIPGDHALLRMMRVSDRLDIYQGEDHYLRVSLRGFTAAYGKLAALCGFRTVGVIE